MPLGISAGTAILGAGAIGGASSLLGAGKASSAAKSAANLQEQNFQHSQALLAPDITTGANVLNPLQNLATSGPTGGGPDYVGMAGGMLPGGPMTEANLAATPGYQFTLDQGLKAVQSQAAARGLGVSGASMKGAATYATGLADQTYGQQFQNLINLNTAQQGNLQNQFSRLQNVASLGANAAAGVGTMGTQAAATAGNFLNQAGLANAAGTTGVANALTGGVNSYLGYNALQQYLNPQTGTGGYGSSAAGTPGISASGNPVMTGFAPPVTPTPLSGGGYSYG